MICKYERGKSHLVNEDGFFKKVLENRYKETPYSIVKQFIGKDWMIYIIESEDVVYGIELAGTKKYAIHKIENNILYNELQEQHMWYDAVTNSLNSYKEYFPTVFS